jgi:DNA-binding HxlR family transcriptional regulator
MTKTLRMTGELEPRDGWSAGAECTIAKSVELLSTRSAFLLMREAFYGATRFEEFVRRAELSEPAASARLHELVEHGLLELEPYQEPGQRTRNRYRLTEKGADLFPVIASLMQWGNRWLSDTGGPAELVHRGCGAVVHAELRCEHGHAVELADLDLAPMHSRGR